MTTAAGSFRTPFSNTPSISVNSPWVNLQANNTYCLVVTAWLQDKFTVKMSRFSPISENYSVESSLVVAESKVESALNVLTMDVREEEIATVALFQMVMKATSGTSQLTRVSEIELFPQSCHFKGSSNKFRFLCLYVVLLYKHHTNEIEQWIVHLYHLQKLKWPNLVRHVISLRTPVAMSTKAPTIYTGSEGQMALVGYFLTDAKHYYHQL